MTENLTTKEKLCADAHQAVTTFVNSQHCQTVQDAEEALVVLCYMTAAALDLVRNGKSEKLS